jgi:hypothetical protein
MRRFFAFCRRCTVYAKAQDGGTGFSLVGSSFGKIDISPRAEIAVSKLKNKC